MCDVDGATKPLNSTAAAAAIMQQRRWWQAPYPKAKQARDGLFVTRTVARDSGVHVLHATLTLRHP